MPGGKVCLLQLPIPIQTGSVLARYYLRKQIRLSVCSSSGFGIIIFSF